MYKYNLKITELINAIETIHDIAQKSNNFSDWFNNTEKYVELCW